MLGLGLLLVVLLVVVLVVLLPRARRDGQTVRPPGIDPLPGQLRRWTADGLARGALDDDRTVGAGDDWVAASAGEG